MLISYNWLRQYLDLVDSITPEEVASRLKASTVEVEGISKQGQGLEGVVVGEIKEIRNHPNADKLYVAQVDVGEKKLRQVIFGQMVKMEKGFKVPVALAPTTLPGGKKIEKVEMRGELTEGMLCLDQELGLVKDGVSIQFFDKKIKNGTLIIDVLGLNDIILEIDNKSLSHRPDLWGHYGIAREVATLFKTDLAAYKPPAIKSGKGLKIAIDNEAADLCSRYMAVAIDGIQVGASPDWLQKRLMAMGLRPINNIVDITNYVMLDLGQPMHAFDTVKLESKKSKIEIVIRRAKEGEKFITLDGQEHELTANMLVIADTQKALALAGVMGGENSQISQSTTTIIFESANFDAACVRKTSTKLGLRTDSSMRFEKALDPHLAQTTLQRAVELTLEVCPGATVASTVVDSKDFHIYQGPLEMRHDFISKKLGKEIEKKEIVHILRLLGFEVEEKKEVLKIKIPTWRATKDISIPEDIVEEVGRIYGFGNIESQLPGFPIKPPEKNKLRALERKIKDLCSLEYHFAEVYNYSFVSPRTIERFGLTTGEHIELDNPIAKDRPFLRRSLTQNLVENVEKNIHLFDEVSLFEIGKVFCREDVGEREWKGSDRLLPKQDTSWALAYAAKSDSEPFFEISNVIIGVLRSLGINGKLQVVEDTAVRWFHPSRSAYVYAGTTQIGYIAELHPEVQTQCGILPRVALAEINLNSLLSLLSSENKYRKLTEYPEVTRDIAFVVDKKIEHADIVQKIEMLNPLITAVDLFDVYEGKNVDENKKSMAYHITYSSQDKTLQASEVDEVHDRVVQTLMENFSAVMR